MAPSPSTARWLRSRPSQCGPVAVHDTSSTWPGFRNMAQHMATIILLLCLPLGAAVPLGAARAVRLPTKVAEVASPVVIVPGDGSNQLEARWNKPSTPHMFCRSVLCPGVFVLDREASQAARPRCDAARLRTGSGYGSPRPSCYRGYGCFRPAHSSAGVPAHKHARESARTQCVLRSSTAGLTTSGLSSIRRSAMPRRSCIGHGRAFAPHPGLLRIHNGTSAAAPTLRIVKTLGTA